uniref:ATP synthase F0 subunit 8 n=1 Tax=Panagrolaimus sp. JU765 TaxID=591449 RepID=A0AC34RI01_9BILA
MTEADCDYNLLLWLILLIELIILLVFLHFFGYSNYLVVKIGNFCRGLRSSTAVVEEARISVAEGNVFDVPLN